MSVTTKEALAHAQKLRRLAANFTDKTDPRHELRATLGEASGYMVVLTAERDQMARVIAGLKQQNRAATQAGERSHHDKHTS